MNKIEFDEIKDIFRGYRVWSDGRDILWYQKAWLALEKEGLTSYENAIDRAKVLIRAYTLMMIYKEFCELEFDEYFDYEFYDWEGESGLSPFRIGQLVSKTLENKDYSDYDEYNEYKVLENAFIDLVDSERGKVVDALIKNSGEGRESTILVSMYLTCVDVSRYEDDWLDTDEDDEEITEEEATEEEMSEYEKYEKDIEKYYGEIVNDVTFGNLAAFSWLQEGTYRIR
ncbi:hypothetical protein EAL2_808p01810 (plasmid) [Peptoclostridium acidaminophilum DSM 3953]|uniref:DUF4240 domain-containing protein n=1 Tax=Peptoclostridium acidaminophilum DSM 3953 TaxID=1286171 RepID=W8UA62_PEPAC|nr:hypothetical protein [Peptoclostridium acidaminophilum]AHM57686.1 hypothetical protein EAL2_808p01810 [Peptoclostridium acidaminophilum DSM 3953]